MLDNGQLVHPVHERVAFLDNAFKLTVDTGNKFIPGKQIGWIYRHLFGTQEVRLNPVFFKLGSINKPAFFKFLDNPRTFTTIDTQFLPEFALEDTFGFRLNQFKCFINRIYHSTHLFVLRSRVQW
jgi:hypothetical protein